MPTYLQGHVLLLQEGFMSTYEAVCRAVALLEGRAAGRSSLPPLDVLLAPIRAVTRIQVSEACNHRGGGLCLMQGPIRAVTRIRQGLAWG